MLMRPVGGEPKPDDHEVDQAGYFTMEEIRGLEPLPAINLEIAQRALASDQRILSPQHMTQLNGTTYTLFVG